VSAARSTLSCGRARFTLGSRTFIMGIVNVTPDSFSDGGRAFTVDDAVRQCVRLLEDGADVLDIGGESTRPGAAPVTGDEERARVLPVIDALIARGIDTISVDTRHADVARAAREHGAAWLNDVEALRGEGMLGAARAFDTVVLMHMRGTPETMQQGPIVYDDVVSDVAAFLDERVRVAGENGIDPARVLVDPGIGFGKTLAHNVALSRGLSRLRGRAAGVLYAPSRKRFLGELTGRTDPAERDDATVGAVCASVQAGADFVRVHDVKRARDALRVTDAIVRSPSS
jgi:dihydropteroate synthase